MVSLRGEEIHVGDAVEKGLVELSSDASFRGRSEGLSGGDESDGNDGGSLHDGIFLEIMKEDGVPCPAAERRGIHFDKETRVAMSQNLDVQQVPVPKTVRH